MLSGKPLAVILGISVVIASLVLSISLREDHATPLRLPGADDGKIRSLTSQVAALQQKVDALLHSRAEANKNNADLRQRVVSLQDRLDEMAGQIDIGQSNPPDAMAENARNRQLLDITEQAYLARQMRDKADSDFRMEEYDPDWANATVSRIRERLKTAEQDAMPGVDVEMASMASNLECRSSSCRLEINHADEAKMMTMQMRVFSSTAGLFDSASTYRTDAGSMVVYMHFQQ